MSAEQAEHLDLSGLACPLPVLRASRRMRAMAPGAELVVTVTDSSAPADFRAFCETAGHAFLDIEAVEGGHRLRIRKGAPAA
jgi:tRNA 2-thiouridine synthesizing protein A